MNHIYCSKEKIEIRAKEMKKRTFYFSADQQMHVCESLQLVQALLSRGMKNKKDKEQKYKFKQVNIIDPSPLKKKKTFTTSLIKGFDIYIFRFKLLGLTLAKEI